MEWEVVIGVEVHAQLTTHSKIFSGSSTCYGASPNTQASAIDLGLPGTLPVLNKAAVEKAIKFGLAIDAKINEYSLFERKNYFYPDLPKGYQISQFQIPIVGKGFIDVSLENEQVKRIGITRAHLEEDAGKSLHGDFTGMCGIDLNRAGVPLLEIVSEPDLRSAKETIAYLKTLHTLVTYLGICDGNMQEGSFRCDANVSVRPKGESKFGTRVEIKNVNSFRFVEQDQLNEYDAAVLVSNRDLAQYFEQVVELSHVSPKLASNWIMGELAAALNKANLEITQSPISPTILGELLQRISDNTISGKIAKIVFEALWAGEGSPNEIIAKRGLKQVTDESAIEKAIDEVLREFPEQLADYRSGKDKLFVFFVGQVMKVTKGQVNPQQLNQLLKEKLS